jgi:hypothetical protein
LLVSGAMHLAVVRAAQWHREFVAGLAAQRARLGKSKMMGIRRFTAAHQARLLDDSAHVLAVSVPT